MQVILSVPLRKCQNVRLGLVLGDGKGGVDIYLVGSGDFVQHHLEGLQVRGEGLTPVKTKSQSGVMASIRSMLRQIFSRENLSYPHTRLY